ncbi:MAG: hypothetical protein ABI369_06440 [Acetobacteraceae bacterium]
MFALHRRMQAPITWKPVTNPIERGREFIEVAHPDNADNPFIPSGYTYLLQFVAHDMVQTRVPFWAVASDPATETSNDQGVRLQLDCLYGDGPTGHPSIYAPDTAEDYSRTRLQLGRAKTGPVVGASTCPFRDLARLQLLHTMQDRPGSLSEPLIADPRNDDHAILSQLTMLFHLLHNTFVALQGRAAGAAPDVTSKAGERFRKARSATTLLYRHVVRHDLLRRILHPAVHDLYNGSANALLDPTFGEPGTDLPLEFSHGAFRFAHVMARPTYRINDGTGPQGQRLSDALVATSSSPIFTGPLEKTWLVQWSNFFNFPGVSQPDRMNLSRRIGTNVAVALLGGPFKAIGPPPSTGGVLYRDLISAGLAHLWSTGALIAAAATSPRHADIMWKSRLLRDAAFRRSSLRDWLAEAPEYWTVLKSQYGIDSADVIPSLADDPPLPFFVLFEALKDETAPGCRLGILGSIIIAETMFGEFHRNKPPAENGGGPLRTRLAAIDPAFDEADFDGSIGMAEAIGFVWKHLKSDPVEESLGLIA